MKGIKVTEIKGKQINYLTLTAEQGYCFYNKDDEEKYYMTILTIPITDIAELERKYIAVVGNAEELNIELDKQRDNTQNNSDLDLYEEVAING